MLLFLCNGSLKYFDPIVDISFVRKGDYMLTLGNKGKALYNFLVAGGVTLNEITLDDIDLKIEELKKRKGFI